MLITPQLLALYSEYPSQCWKMNRFQQCGNVPPAWTEMSNSYSVCRDVNTHTGIERCVMYLSSFRTFPSFFIIIFFNPRAHSAHNTWTTLWSFRSFSSKMQSSSILSTITIQWKFSYRIFTYIQNEISFLISLSTHNSKICVPKVTKSFIFYQKDLSHTHTKKKKKKKKNTQGNRIGVATFLQGENLDLNRCTCNDKTLSAN